MPLDVATEAIAVLGIQRTIALYGQLLDDHRFEEWADLFTDDAVWATPDIVFAGRLAIREGLREMERMPPGAVKHMALTPIVAIVGEHHADAWTDLFCLVRLNPEDPWSLASAGRYCDHLEESGGRWRFRARFAHLCGAPPMGLDMPVSPVLHDYPAG